VLALVQRSEILRREREDDARRGSKREERARSSRSLTESDESRGRMRPARRNSFVPSWSPRERDLAEVMEEMELADRERRKRSTTPGPPPCIQRRDSDRLRRPSVSFAQEERPRDIEREQRREREKEKERELEKERERDRSSHRSSHSTHRRDSSTRRRDDRDYSTGEREGSQSSQNRRGSTTTRSVLQGAGIVTLLSLAADAFV